METRFVKGERQDNTRPGKENDLVLVRIVIASGHALMEENGLVLATSGQSAGRSPEPENTRALGAVTNENVHVLAKCSTATRKAPAGAAVRRPRAVVALLGQCLKDKDLSAVLRNGAKLLQTLWRKNWQSS